MSCFVAVHACILVGSLPCHRLKCCGLEDHEGVSYLVGSCILAASCWVLYWAACYSWRNCSIFISCCRCCSA